MSVSSCLHSCHTRSEGLRIRGTWFAAASSSKPVMWLRRFAGRFAKVMPSRLHRDVVLITFLSVTTIDGSNGVGCFVPEVRTASAIGPTPATLAHGAVSICEIWRKNVSTV